MNVLKAILAGWTARKGPSIDLVPLHTISKEDIVPLLPWPATPPMASAVHEFDESLLEQTPGASLRAEVLQRARSGSSQSLDETAPRLQYSGELIMGSDGSTPISVVLGSVVGRDIDSVTFAAESLDITTADAADGEDDGMVYGDEVPVPGTPANSQSVIKYFNNCRNVNAFDPGDREYEFQQKAYAIGVGLKPIFKSPPTKLVVPRSDKTNFDMPFDEYESCAARDSTVVRFVVVERLGKTVADVIEDREGNSLRVSAVLKFFHAAFSKLRKLHAANILHKRLSFYSVGVMTDGQIKFDDFRDAAYASDSFGMKPKTAVLPPLNPIEMSPFELGQYRSGFRDDVYRLFWMASVMMCGDALVNHVRDIWDETAEVIEFKTSGDWFGPAFCSEVDFGDDPNVDRVRVLRQMERMREVILSSPSADLAPDYEELKRLIKKTRALVDSPGTFTRLSLVTDKARRTVVEAFTNPEIPQAVKPKELMKKLRSFFHIPKKA